jgi:hypothetical protein
MPPSDQRFKFKETIRSVEQKNEALEQTATAALLEVQSCTRQLHVGSCLTRDLEVALEQVVDESSTTATELHKLQGTNKVLRDELHHVRKQIRVVKLEKAQGEMQKKAERLEEKLVQTKAEFLKGQNLRVLTLSEVLTLFLIHNVICVLTCLFLCLSFISNKEIKEQKKTHANTNNIMELRAVPGSSRRCFGCRVG